MEPERHPARGLLGHPLAYVLIAGLIAIAFSWTFFVHPGRPLANDDPAYYTWRTEALMENAPAAVLGMTGPLEMYSSGYRVGTPTFLAILRQTTGVSFITPTILLAVGMRLLIALLLAGYAFRHFGDPLAWHAVALGSASLLLFPPFAGYMDNMFALTILALSLFFMDAARTTVRGRVGMALLMFVAGLTHPTTLAAFLGVLVIAAGLRLAGNTAPRRFALSQEAALLGSAFGGAVVAYLAWKASLWGVSRPLADATLPPPAPASFFKARLGDWVSTMRPALNLPIMMLGAAGLVAGGRRMLREDLPRITFAWLVPLVGVLGVVAGFAYPYYRFFNIAAGWVLLFGIGVYVCARFASDRITPRWLQGAFLMALMLLLATNLGAGYEGTSWNRVGAAWIAPEERVEMDAVGAALSSTMPERPIIFVVDAPYVGDTGIYGFAKRAGNVSRYSVPGTRQGETAFFLGSLADAVARRPSSGPSDYYRFLSAASLADVERVAQRTGGPPLYVVASTFNDPSFRAQEGGSYEDEVWFVQGSQVRSDNGPLAIHPERVREGGGVAGAVLASLVLLALLLPGWLAAPAIRSVRASALGPAILGVVPALSLVLVAASGILVLAIARAPMSFSSAWLSVAMATLAGAALGGRHPLTRARSPVA